MTPLEKMKEFLQNFPRAAELFPRFHVDYTDQIPDNGGLFPSGLVEVSRVYDIIGDCTVTNQYNFGLYCVLEKAPGDDVLNAENAELVMELQRWIQEQSILGKAPTFGDQPREEAITAQNGALYAAEDEGTGIYMMQISVRFVKELRCN